MKILLTADIHYSLKQFDWLYRVADGYDLVVMAGDHLDIASNVDGRVQIAVALNTLKRIAGKTRLVASSGNHDLDRRNESGEKYAGWMSDLRQYGIATDGESVLIEDCLFSICPWWDGPETMSLVADQLARDSAASKSKWIWIYHAPPEGSPTSREATRSFGDPALRNWIEEYRPDAVLCGHVHHAPFHQGGAWVDRIGSTWVFNAGRQIGEIPAHVILELQHDSAIWLSIAGAEIAALGSNAKPYQEPLQALPDWLKSPDRIRVPTQV